MYNELKELLNKYYKYNFNSIQHFHIVVEDLNLDDKFISGALYKAEIEQEIYNLLLSVDVKKRKELMIKYYDTDYKEMRAKDE